jgi:hypothetical protein
VPSQPKRVLKCRTAKPDIRRCCGNRRFGLARGQVVSLTPIFLVWPYLHLLVSVRVAHNRRRKRQRASGILRRVQKDANASGKVYVSDGEQRAHDATLRRAAPAAPAPSCAASHRHEGVHWVIAHQRESAGEFRRNLAKDPASKIRAGVEGCRR